MKEVDEFAAARHMLKLFSESWNNVITILDELERDGYSNMFIHVYYSDIVKDPYAVISQIHSHFQLPDPSIDRMKQWVSQNPKNKHGVHKYSLEDYGLTPADVHRAFEPYYRRFFPNVPLLSQSQPQPQSQPQSQPQLQPHSRIQSAL
jgi:hypothetical protein